MSNQGYSTAELLALRSAPLSPHPTTSSHPFHLHPSPRRAALPEADYQALHRAVIANRTATFSFAHYEADPSITHLVIPTPDASTVRYASPAPASQLFTPRARLSRCLRYGRNVACFNLYPACRRDLHVNDLLWQVAQTGEYDPAHGNILLENNVLSLSIPREFYSFLSNVSREHLNTCMLQLLALIAEDEDAEGLALMRSELDVSVWCDLERYMASSDADSKIDGGTDRGRKLIKDVEMLLRLCYLSPWKIDVYAAYVTPQDMATVLSENSRGADISIDVSDRKLVRSAARRPVSTSLSSASQLPPRARALSKTEVFWKLFLDWRRYRKVLVQGLGIDAAEVTSTMLHSIAKGTQRKSWERAELIMACSTRPGNLFSQLPREVVFNIVAPHVLLAGSKL